MKLTNLSAAPGETEAPPRAFRRFAAVRTGSQLIPGVGRLVRGGEERSARHPGVDTALGLKRSTGRAAPVPSDSLACLHGCRTPQRVNAAEDSLYCPFRGRANGVQRLPGLERTRVVGVGGRARLTDFTLGGVAALTARPACVSAVPRPRGPRRRAPLRESGVRSGGVRVLLAPRMWGDSTTAPNKAMKPTRRHWSWSEAW
jgi:hypothetical protein